MQFVNSKKIHHDLLKWYQENSRSLPWRDINDPYLVWISEVMLQQTQVETVFPYFEKWKTRFPNVQTLAEASEEQVLKLWEGLGYYSRARNIKRSADIIQQEYGGKIPASYNELVKLPGIGDYIASAIASIAFDLPVSALEANGIRVVSRLFNFKKEVTRSGNKKILKEYLESIVAYGQAGDVNQAVMDLGSAVCVNGNPKCQACPISVYCISYLNGEQNMVPLKKEKKPVPHYDVVAGVIIDGRRVLITKRPADKLLGGMWEYPGGKVEQGEARTQALQRELQEELGIITRIISPLGQYAHAYTHFSVTVFTYLTEIIGGVLEAVEVSDLRWVEFEKLDEFPMGKVDRLISRDLQREYLK